MKKFLYPFGIIILLFAATSCSKPGSIPSPSNMNLSKKALPEVKAVLFGKWQLHYLRGGFCGVCEYQRDDEFYEFGLNDHIKWTIGKQVMSDTTITWLKQDWQNKQINVMEFYANDLAHHLLSPDIIIKDTLQMYEPGPDGMTYYFTKVK